MRVTSVGACTFCDKEFAGNAMTKHLASCEKRKVTHNGGGERVYLLRAGSGSFWVYFEAGEMCNLEDVDEFLRDLWLECCGHLSMFTINDVDYLSSPEPGEKGMKTRIGYLFSPGLSFTHEYDFGTTTYLSLKCVSERKGSIRGIRVLARNNLPIIPCAVCKKPAKEICGECVWENGMLCSACAKKHKCGEDMLLPYVNSPRAGMCGYTGDE